MPKMKPFLEWMISVFSCVMAAASWFHLMENVEEMLCWARQDFVLLGVWQVLEQVPRMSFLEEWTSVLVCCQMAASRVSYDRKMVRKYCQARLSSLSVWTELLKMQSKVSEAFGWSAASCSFFDRRVGCVLLVCCCHWFLMTENVQEFCFMLFVAGQCICHFEVLTALWKMAKMQFFSTRFFCWFVGCN